MSIRLCFIHLPKTGGTTLATYLDDMFERDRICPVQDQYGLEHHAVSPDKYDLFRGHFELYRLPESIRSGTNLITILRHPVPRAISRFHHWRRDPELLATLMRTPLLYNHNIQTLALSPLPMDGYTTLREHLNAAKRILSQFYFVGLQEQFSASGRALFQMLGYPAPRSLRRHNASDYDISAVPQTLVDEITTANWADLELYEHAAVLFKERFLPLADQADNQDYPLGPLPQCNRIHYRMDQALMGTGWHEREGFGPADVQCWRWTGPDPESSLMLPLRTGLRYEFSIRILNAVSPEVLNSMRVLVNGHVLSLQQQRAWRDRFMKPKLPGWLYLGVVTPDMLRSGKLLTRVDILVSNTIPQCESDPNSSNKRSCGLAITEINFNPVPGDNAV